MRTITPILTGLIILVPLLVFSDTKQEIKVAVLDFNALGLKGEEIREITDRFRENLAAHLSFAVYETDKMYTVMDNRGYPRQIPCTDDTCIIELGGVLGVNYIAAANVGKIGDVYSITLWMLEVNTGHVVSTVMENYQCGYREFVDSHLPQISNKLAHSLQQLKRGLYAPGQKQGQWITFSRENGALPTNKILALEEDQQGNIWVGMKEQGVARYDGRKWKIYTTRDGLADNDVWAIGTDTKGNQWFGTIGGGISRFDGKKWQTFNQQAGVASNYISGIRVNRRSGDIWFLTWDMGVFVYRQNRFIHYTEKDGLIDNDVRSMGIDPAGGIWFGTYQGVSHFDGKNWTSYVSNYTYGHYADNGNCPLADNYVRCIMVDREGGIWFGTYSGISRLHGGRWANFTKNDGLADNDVRSIHLDERGQVWCGTYAGVCKYDGTNWVSFTAHDGLVENDIKIVEVDRQDNKWFCTSSKGISVYTGD